MDVSVIYVNYKTSRLIADSIRSVVDKTTGLSYEVIVVDNNSEDDSETFIRTLFPKVTYIASPENVGFGRANNLGIAVAKGKAILCLNPDTLLRNNAIRILYDYLMADSHIGAVGGNLFDEEMRPAFSLGRRFPSLWEEFLSVFYLKPLNWRYPRSSYFNHTGKPLSVASIVGADLMIKKDVLTITGGFDPDFFMNYEETELCYRIKKAGFKIHAVPFAEIIHLEGKAEYVSESRKQFFENGKYIYFSKSGSKCTVSLLYVLISLKCYVRMFRSFLWGNKKRMSYWKTNLMINKKAYRRVV